MKKWLLLFSALLVTAFPALAQGEEQTEEIPTEMLILKKGNIPPAVIKAAEDLFKGSTQLKWGVFPNEFKNYGWVKDKDYNEPIDHYEIYLKTSNGGDAYAVFEPTGELIRYRLMEKNAALPQPVLNAIAKSEYKDWKISGDTELIKSQQKKVVDHYAVKLAKGNQKKTVYYSMTGDVLTNKK